MLRHVASNNERAWRCFWRRARYESLQRRLGPRPSGALKLLRESLAKSLPTWQIESPEGRWSLWVDRQRAHGTTWWRGARCRRRRRTRRWLFGGECGESICAWGISAIPTHLIAEGVTVLAEAVSTAVTSRPASGQSRPTVRGDKLTGLLRRL